MGVSLCKLVCFCLRWSLTLIVFIVCFNVLCLLYALAVQFATIIMSWSDWVRVWKSVVEVKKNPKTGHHIHNHTIQPNHSMDGSNPCQPTQSRFYRCCWIPSEEWSTPIYYWIVHEVPQQMKQKKTKYSVKLHKKLHRENNTIVKLLCMH